MSWFVSEGLVVQAAACSCVCVCVRLGCVYKLRRHEQQAPRHVVCPSPQWQLQGAGPALYSTVPGNILNGRQSRSACSTQHHWKSALARSEKQTSSPPTRTMQARNHSAATTIHPWPCLPALFMTHLWLPHRRAISQNYLRVEIPKCIHNVTM